MISSVKFSGSDVIEDVCLPFSEGLNVITGETGTGKTVLINLRGYTLGFPLQIPFFLKKGQVEVRFSQGQEEYVPSRFAPPVKMSDCRLMYCVAVPAAVLGATQLS